MLKTFLYLNVPGKKCKLLKNVFYCRRNASPWADPNGGRRAADNAGNCHQPRNGTGGHCHYHFSFCKGTGTGLVLVVQKSALSDVAIISSYIAGKKHCFWNLFPPINVVYLIGQILESERDHLTAVKRIIIVVFGAHCNACAVINQIWDAGLLFKQKCRENNPPTLWNWCSSEIQTLLSIVHICVQCFIRRHANWRFCWGEE